MAGHFGDFFVTTVTPLCPPGEKYLGKPIWVNEPVDIPQFSQVHV